MFTKNPLITNRNIAKQNIFFPFMKGKKPLFSLPKVNVISFHLNKYNLAYPAYKKLTADQKISRIESHIKNSLAKFPKDPKDGSLKMIFWGDGGVAESESYFASLETRNQLIEVMNKVSQQDASLVIIAGTIAYKEHFDQFTPDLFKELENEYAKLDWVNQYEMEDKTIAEEIEREFQKVKKIYLKNPNMGVDVIRNACYVFQNGTYQCHEKTACINETRRMLVDNQVFRPGDHSTQSPIFTLIHPSINRKITMAVEICREHTAGLTAMLVNKKLTQRPDFLVLLSDSSTLTYKNMCARFVIHNDTILSNKLITTQKNLIHAPVHLYQVNLMTAEENLRGPLQPVYPVITQVSDLLRKGIDEISKMPDNAAILRKLQSIHRIYRMEYELLVKMQARLCEIILTVYKACDRLLQEITEFSLQKNTVHVNNTLFSSYKEDKKILVLTKLTEEINKIYQRECEKKEKYMDIASIEDEAENDALEKRVASNPAYW